MATVKITDLPYITSLQPNTANSVLVGVDVPGNYTGQITLTTLAQGLYSNNDLKVGNNDIIYANAVGQFTGNSASYLQVTLRNQRGQGSGDFVVTADDGNDGTHYLDMGLNGSTYNDPTFSATKAHDGYLYVQSNDPQGNLVLGTVSSNARINFIVGGTLSQNIVSYIDRTGIYSPSVNSLVAANVATLRDEITANATSANSVINSRITANIATANLFTQAAFDKANNALANTTGTFGGTLTVSQNFNVGNFKINNGYLFQNNYITVANSTFDSSNHALIQIIGSTGAALQVPSNPGYMLQIVGVDGIASRVINTGYGTGAYGLYAGRHANGTAASPTAASNNDILARFSGSGYNGTSFTSTGQGRIDIVAEENYTTANNGSRIEFYNTIPGTNTVNKIATFNSNTAQFTGAVYPNKGFIYSPRILNGAQTAITIDFSSDSIIRATFNSALTISLSNYTYGKIVDVWVTNTAGNGQTVNFGVLANNSTTGATSLSVAAGRSAKLQYFSIDGDQANTFLAVTYA